MIMAADNVVRIGKLELHFLVDEAASNSELIVFEFVVPPGAKVPVAHYHRDVDEVIYGLSGTTTTSLNGEKHELGAGDSLFIPRGSVHTHENLHGETAKSLIVMTPGSIGRSYFEEIAAQVNVPGKPDLAKLKDIMAHYGLIPG